MSSHLITVLFKATKTLEEKIKEDVLKYDLTLAEFGVLEALFHKKELYVSELCQKVLVPNSSMTYTLDKLDAQNLIERKKNLKDKRSYSVNLTKKGYDKMEKILMEHYKFLDTLIITLNEDEKTTLRHFLKRIGIKDELQNN